VVDQQRVHGEREPDGTEAQPLEEAVPEFLRAHVERPDHRDRGPRPQDVCPDHFDERSDHDEE
jgi:hypothetical protein